MGMSEAQMFQTNQSHNNDVTNVNGQMFQTNQSLNNDITNVNG